MSTGACRSYSFSSSESESCTGGGTCCKQIKCITMIQDTRLAASTFAAAVTPSNDTRHLETALGQIADPLHLPQCRRDPPDQVRPDSQVCRRGFGRRRGVPDVDVEAGWGEHRLGEDWGSALLARGHVQNCGLGAARQDQGEDKEASSHVTAHSRPVSSSFPYPNTSQCECTKKSQDLPCQSYVAAFGPLRRVSSAVTVMVTCYLTPWSVSPYRVLRTVSFAHHNDPRGGRGSEAYRY